MFGSGLDSLEQMGFVNNRTMELKFLIGNVLL